MSWGKNIFFVVMVLFFNLAGVVLAGDVPKPVSHPDPKVETLMGKIRKKPVNEPDWSWIKTEIEKKDIIKQLSLQQMLEVRLSILVNFIGDNDLMNTFLDVSTSPQSLAKTQIAEFHALRGENRYFSGKFFFGPWLTAHKATKESIGDLALQDIAVIVKYYDELRSDRKLKAVMNDFDTAYLPIITNLRKNTSLTPSLEPQTAGTNASMTTALLNSLRGNTNHISDKDLANVAPATLSIQNSNTPNPLLMQR